MGKADTDIVDSYTDDAVAAFNDNPNSTKELEGRSWKLGYESLKSKVGEAFPFVAGFIAFFWIFSLVVGWIVRGFAGIPNGKDFR